MWSCPNISVRSLVWRFHSASSSLLHHPPHTKTKKQNCLNQVRVILWLWSECMTSPNETFLTYQKLKKGTKQTNQRARRVSCAQICQEAKGTGKDRRDSGPTLLKCCQDVHHQHRLPVCTDKTTGQHASFFTNRGPVTKICSDILSCSTRMKVWLLLKRSLNSPSLFSTCSRFPCHTLLLFLFNEVSFIFFFLCKPHGPHSTSKTHTQWAHRDSHFFYSLISLKSVLWECFMPAASSWSRCLHTDWRSAQPRSPPPRPHLSRPSPVSPAAALSPPPPPSHSLFLSLCALCLSP